MIVPRTGPVTANSPQPTTVTRPGVIFVHIRNLEGIISSLAAPPPWDDTPLPFLGNVATEYLQAHGYNVSSVLHVAAAFQAAATSDDFALTLAQKGLPILEGRFLWHLIQFDSSESNALAVRQSLSPVPFRHLKLSGIGSVDKVHTRSTYHTAPSHTIKPLFSLLLAIQSSVLSG